MPAFDQGPSLVLVGGLGGFWEKASRLGEKAQKKGRREGGGRLAGPVVVVAIRGDLFGLLGVQVLLQGDAELLAQGLQLVEVLLVLLLVLDLGLDALEDADGRGVVVDAAGGLEGGHEDRGRGHQIVGEGVVQVALRGGENQNGSASEGKRECVFA